ncbi:peptide ABC transporter permease [Bdellovibrio bacteriovorus]|uniref:Peptide ABC transporter permease n=1 Tax=Bdellovibrio bacteriovorus TaxID=959 RepID=A0A150WEY4_BDEBC|nr:ABC transporter permease [Bdellovibrio bacteriovorus]KYG61576.1 peptide ABC transporter permease [Bdellovibrio bacteriovorus]
MIFLKLAIKSLRNRAFSTTLTVISICLSVTLLLTVERAKRAAEEGFTQTISRTDLIVGARSGPLQLILYTVFNMGNATHNISYDSYKTISQLPNVAWTIPYSLGDGHRGFRVVGTNEDFFKYYHYRGYQKVELEQGVPFDKLWDVVIGADVANKLGYKLGNRIVISHGVTKTEGVLNHDDKPFVVSGIMKPTGTPLDRAVYVSLEGMEALHLDWQDGSAPTSDKVIPKEKISKENIKVDTITAFFLGAKSRAETLRLQREINDFKSEPLLAIIPGVVLSELWQGLSYIEGVLRGISWMVVVVGFLGMLIALTTTLNERRREMAILRAVGARSFQIVGLLVFESALLTTLGVLFGVLLSYVSMAVLGPWAEREFGLYLAGAAFTKKELLYVIVTLVGGTVIGLIPALRAQRLALKDGLSIKI